MPMTLSIWVADLTTPFFLTAKKKLHLPRNFAKFYKLIKAQLRF